jgi:hypothetical protein
VILRCVQPLYFPTRLETISCLVTHDIRPISQHLHVSPPSLLGRRESPVCKAFRLLANAEVVCIYVGVLAYLYNGAVEESCVTTR